MPYRVTDTIIVDQSRNLSSIGIATFSGPVIVGVGTSTRLSVTGDIAVSGIVTGSVLVAAKDSGTGIATDFTESIFGNGWRLSAPASTTYYRLATLPAGGSGNTFDHLVINGVLGSWISNNQTPFEIYFSNRNSFTTKYISYGSVRSDVRILGISTNSTVEIWAQHQASQFTKLVYNITNSLQVIPVLNPVSTTTAPVGTTVFDSSTATPRFIINDSDNVGIGTINPGSKLAVQGDLSIASTLGIGTVIDIVPYDTLNSGTLSFEGSAGQLFSITNNLTSGSIFSVNDVSGIPSIDVNADGTVSLGAYGGNIGVGTTSATSKLSVTGNVLVSGIVTATSFRGDGSQLTGITAAGVGAISGITVRDSNNNIVGTSGSITQLTFGSGLSVTGTTGTAGIATITLSGNIVGTSLSISGISTSGGFNATTGNDYKINGTSVLTSTTLGSAVVNSSLTSVGTLGILNVTGVTTASRFVSNVAQGTAPISVASSTLVTNLNADFLDGLDSSYFTNASNLSSGIVPSARITAASGDFNVGQNLNVTGNITIGGTTAILNAVTLQIKDKDIVLGITTNASNQDVSTDTTANHGGVAIASTEGTPLIDINAGVGTDSIPSTYKQIMWLKSGSWTGLGTDAWLFNYGVGIGSTQVPNGVRLAVGGVQFTQNDLAVVRSINASGVSTLGTVQISSGIVTATSGVVTYYGDGSKLTGIQASSIVGVTTYATNAGYATTAGISTSVIGGISSVTQLSVSGVSTVGFLTATNIWNAGITTSSRINLNGANSTSDGGGQIYLNGATGNRIDFNTNGVGAPAFTTRSVGTKLVLYPAISGSSVDYAFGIEGSTLWSSVFDSTASFRWYAGTTNIATLSGTGNLTIGGGVSGATATPTNINLGTNFSNGTTRDKLKIYLYNSGTEQYGFSVGSASDVQYHSNIIHDFYVANTAAVRINGSRNLLIGSQTDTGTASQRLQVTGGAYVSGDIGIGNTNPGAKLDVAGDIRLSAADPEIEFNSGGPRLKVSASNTLTIHTGGGLNTTSNEIVRINNTGVGVGTTDPGARLHVVPTSTGIAGLFSGTTSSDMVRITQTGTGNALVVEDSTNPDSTPFVVNANGLIGIGTTNPTSKLTVSGDVLVSGATTSAEFVGGGFDLRNLSGTHLVSYASASDVSNSALSISGISSYSQVGILTGSFAVDASDSFGYSVATSADGKTIVVGAYLDEIVASNTGVVYVFDRVGNSFNQVGILTGIYAVDTNDFFGIPVATSADGKTIIVGSYSDEIGATTSTGVVYVFDRVGNSFNQVGILTGSFSVNASDSFGYSVATSADGKTIVVGAYFDEIGATTNNGVVYVFDRVGNSFNQVGILTGSFASQISDNFGYSVATSADGKTIIVGATQDEIGATLSTGVVYVFDRVGNSFNQVGILTGSLAVDASDNFGYSVATSADGKTIVVGASSDEIGATTSTGVVYVFDRVGNSFNQVGILTGTYAVDIGDRFGYSVATSADGKTIVVGASSDEIGATTDTGVVYVYKRQGNNFNQVGILTSSLAAESNDDFGKSVAISADGKTIIVGAPGDEIGATTDTGVVYVYDEVRETYVYSGPTGNLGIGTTNPTSKLTVQGNALITGVATVTNNFTVDSGTIYADATNNRVGINTLTPAFTADIAGDARITSTNKMRFGGTAGTTNFYIQYNSTTNSLDFVAG